MRELSVVEFDMVVGGMYYQYETIDENGGDGGGGGSYSYNLSYLDEASDGSGNWVGVGYESDSSYLQAEAQAQSIDWEVGGEVGSGGWKITAKVSGKS
ncbi:MAG: hypothetical protein ACK40O_06485 [Allosphingosinicella sp.]